MTLIIFVIYVSYLYIAIYVFVKFSQHSDIALSMWTNNLKQILTIFSYHANLGLCRNILFCYIKGDSL